MTAKMQAKKKMGRPRKYTNTKCSTGCGADYVPHEGSRGRCPTCSRNGIPPAEPGRYPEGTPRPEEDWKVLGPHPDGEHADWQLEAAYKALYALAPLSALMLGRRIKELEAKMTEIQKLARS